MEIFGTYIVTDTCNYNSVDQEAIENAYKAVFNVDKVKWFDVVIQSERQPKQTESLTSCTAVRMLHINNKLYRRLFSHLAPFFIVCIHKGVIVNKQKAFYAASICIQKGFDDTTRVFSNTCSIPLRDSVAKLIIDKKINSLQACSEYYNEEVSANESIYDFLRKKHGYQITEVAWLESALMYAFAELAYVDSKST